MFGRFKERGKTPKRPSARTRVKKLSNSKLGKSIFQARHSQGDSQASLSIQDSSKLNVGLNSLTKGNKSLFDADDDIPGTAAEDSLRSLNQSDHGQAEVEEVQVTSPKARRRHARTGVKPVKRNLRNKDVITIPDDDDEEYADETKSVTKTYTQSIPLDSMQQTWTVLTPNVQTMLESILTLFIEQSLSSISFKNKKDRLRLRSLVRSLMIRPLMKRFRHVKLPPGIKESHLDQEQLNEEKLRLETNYDANLKQLEGLQTELLKEQQRLKGEQKYTREYESKVNESKKLMERSLDQIRNLLGDDFVSGEENDKPTKGKTEADSLGLQDGDAALIVSDSFANNGDTIYDISKDVQLTESLETLQAKLSKVDSNITVVKDLSAMLDRIHNILGLAK
ncbi:DEKNAAC101702 [Brettanomyces naardenensis]|uniref:DEKNAAC101702 n=1 Tax=Brettanomyces naardenensis TaxID=13370 RepID=A0A448YIY9_BRENA|nr:DEKNAAC101702 [Brettanomyces naardenensis]